MTSFGEAVILLTFEGIFFSARSAKEIKKMAIEAPENGLAAYHRAAASERFQGLSHAFDKFRYNDIQYYRNDKEQGLVISYIEFDEDNDCYRTALATLLLDPSIHRAEQIAANEGDWDVVFRTQPCLPLKKQYLAIEGHMAGGRIAFEAPDTIYLGSGDYNWDGVWAPEVLAQNPDVDYGKVIAINLTSGQAKIVSTGHRNMQGIVLDQNHQLWVVEHGMRGGDELNRVVEGTNYGWPEETLGTLYSRLPMPNTKSYGRHDTFTRPTFAWLPSVAISSLTLIEGFHASWDGDLLMATLRDRSLFRIRVKDNRVVFTERIKIGQRIRYVHQHNDGRLVLWTDERRLIFLSVAEQTFAALFIEKYIDSAEYDDTRRNQVTTAVNSCMECHSMESGVHTNAPSLGLIFGSPIGATSYSNYSDVLRDRGGHWSREELTAFLQDPATYASGTSMPNPGIDDPFVLNELINILEALKSSP